MGKQASWNYSFVGTRKSIYTSGHSKNDWDVRSSQSAERFGAHGIDSVRAKHNPLIQKGGATPAQNQQACELARRTAVSKDKHEGDHLRSPHIRAPSHQENPGGIRLIYEHYMRQEGSKSKPKPPKNRHSRDFVTGGRAHRQRWTCTPPAA